MGRTYEEMLASQTELAHFNPNHDPSTGRFAKSRFGAALNRRRDIERKRTADQKDRQELHKDMNDYFRSHIKNEELRKRVSISRTGEVNTDELRSAARKGKVTEKDIAEVKAAKDATEKYVLSKYGEKEYKKRAEAYEVKDLPLKDKVKMVAIGSAAVALAVSAIKFRKTDEALKWISEGTLGVDPTKYLGVSLAKAGIAAAGSSAALIGGSLVSDYINAGKNETAKKKSKE